MVGDSTVMTWYGGRRYRTHAHALMYIGEGGKGLCGAAHHGFDLENGDRGLRANPSALITLPALQKSRRSG